MKRLVLALLLALLFAACSSQREAPSPAPAPQPVAAQPSKVITLDAQPSIYDLDTAMTDASGKAIKLDVDRGHVTIIAMFYASCTIVCPLTVSDIKQTIAALPPAAQNDVRVLLVSFDPARDTPAVLAGLAKQHQLDDRWTLAVPNETDARTLAATISVKYRKLEDGQIAHNIAITVLDQNGQPIARAEQFGQHAGLAAAIANAMVPPNS